MQQAIARQNSDVPGGNVTDARRELTLRTMGRYADPAAFQDLVVDTRNGVPIRTIHESLGLSRSTIYRLLQQRGQL